MKFFWTKPIKKELRKKVCSIWFSLSGAEFLLSEFHCTSAGIWFVLNHNNFLYCCLLKNDSCCFYLDCFVGILYPVFGVKIDCVSLSPINHFSPALVHHCTNSVNKCSQLSERCFVVVFLRFFLFTHNLFLGIVFIACRGEGGWGWELRGGVGGFPKEMWSFMSGFQVLITLRWQETREVPCIAQWCIDSLSVPPLSLSLCSARYVLEFKWLSTEPHTSCHIKPVIQHVEPVTKRVALVTLHLQIWTLWLTNTTPEPVTHRTRPLSYKPWFCTLGSRFWDKIMWMFRCWELILMAVFLWRCFV